MTSTQKRADSTLAVGSRVRTKFSLDRAAAADAKTWETGSIVEDFAADVDPSLVSRDWGLAHRWGVALDNGCLVFRDSDDLEGVDAPDA